MKIIITIEDAGNEQVTFSFMRKGKFEGLHVLRATIRMMRAIDQEYRLIEMESQEIQRTLDTLADTQPITTR